MKYMYIWRWPETGGETWVLANDIRTAREEVVAVYGKTPACKMLLKGKPKRVPAPAVFAVHDPYRTSYY